MMRYWAFVPHGTKHTVDNPAGLWRGETFPTQYASSGKWHTDVSLQLDYQSELRSHCVPIPESRAAVIAREVFHVAV